MSIFAYINNHLSSEYSLSWSFALSTTAWLLSFVTAILAYYESQNIIYMTASSAVRKGGAGMM